MSWKLSIAGIKHRMRDYIVLFSGLVMAAAIFYMFESMASNEAFLKSNSIISSTVIIFRFGSVLLGIITFVYILYANSFLMTIRQKDYAMYMMLGAKGRKIAQLIFLETLIVGATATIVGSVLGIGLTTVVYRLLVEQLSLKITHFSAISGAGLTVTFLFFALLFLAAAFINGLTIVKKPILTLLRANQTPNKLKRQRFLLKVVVGVLCLAIGYYMMARIEDYQELAIGVALLTIISGTYLLFSSVLIFLLSLLKKNETFAFKRLNNFTLAQVSFRIREYTQMLSMVAMLFAMALGALTVGLGFKHQVITAADQSSPYDLILNHAEKVDPDKVSRLSPVTDAVYTQKEDGQTVYYDASEFSAKPLFAAKTDQSSDKQQTIEKMTGEGNEQERVQEELRGYELPDQQKKASKLISHAEFKALDLPQQTLRLVQVDDFVASLPKIKSLAEENKKNNPSLQEMDFGSQQKYDTYDLYNTIFSGFEFMGFFLGLAFLTMLASCLMFKILSGSQSDRIRYDMLDKIGTRRGLLKQSIRREIGVLFFAPGIVGIIHVLFGLQMFSMFLSNPYQTIWLPFALFFFLYFLYYCVTVWLYQDIVLKKP